MCAFACVYGLSSEDLKAVKKGKRKLLIPFEAMPTLTVARRGTDTTQTPSTCINSSVDAEALLR